MKVNKKKLKQLLKEVNEIEEKIFKIMGKDISTLTKEDEKKLKLYQKKERNLVGIAAGDVASIPGLIKLVVKVIEKVVE